MSVANYQRRDLTIGLGQEHFVEVDLPASEQDAGFPGPALMHIALWMPMDLMEPNVPVIATIHPYYDFGGEGIVGDDSNPNTVPDRGVGEWVLDQFVPHGYALAQVSTFRNRAIHTLSRCQGTRRTLNSSSSGMAYIRNGRMEMSA